jgi:ketosteroid isomerase-like protein
MLKYIIKSILFVGLCFIKLPVTFGQQNAIEATHTILQQQQEAWNQGNLESYMQGYWHNDSLMFVGKNGITYGWEATLAQYKKSYADTAAMGHLKFKILNTQQLSQQYIQVIGAWHLTRTQGDVGGHFTLLFKHINNRWYIISDHSS